MSMERDVDHLITLAAKNLDRGVIEEPRFFFDIVTLNTGGTMSKDDPAAFLNGEDFPITLTHLAFATRPDYGADPVTGLDDRILQRIGARFIFHDQYYQSRQFAPVPLWGNKVTTGPQALSQSFVAHTFDRPVILSARDALKVTVALEVAPSQGTKRCSVGFHGIGLQSKRPYFFQGYRDLGDTTPMVLNASDFRNDGAEPVGLTDMVINLGADSGGLSGTGDVRQVRVQISQIGNGTGRNWVVFPTIQATMLPLPQIPAQLLGFTEGRSVVHRLPGNGIVFEPNEGFILEAAALAAAAEGIQLGVCAAGYISLV